MRLRLLVVCVAAGSLALAGADLASAAVDFTDRAPGRLIVTAPAYRLSLSKADGGLVSLLDSSSGDVVVRGLRGGCLWRAATALDATCDGSFSYRWDAPASTLHLAYTGGGVDAAVDVVARDASFDLRATVTNHTGRPLVSLALPADVVGAVDAVRAGYSPTYLPGVEFSPGFFGHVGGNVLVYPSRWAFADYLALDVAGGRLALYAVDPPPAPISPARVGFHHDGSGACSDNAFCIRHDFQTWIRNGATWTSPAVRLVTGRTPEQTIGDYRRDNGVDRYPSLAEKLGPRLDVLERAPEVKADLEKGLPPFAGWGPGLARLPSPALVHPVAFSGGHDVSDPDFLPPAPAVGTDADFRAMIGLAHARGDLVMPYLNVTWWLPESPTLNGRDAASVAVRDVDGEPVTEPFSGRLGYVVSPFAPLVRDRVARLFDEWRTDVPADCLFFDQIGARPWIRDLSAAATDPLAYEDGWLALLAPHADRCLMVEDGWDRLAQSFVGFHGSALLQEREYTEPDGWWGPGNWQAYPLADWLLHDKVLLYQHDLYEGTLTADGPTLAWNLAFGFVLSTQWNEWTSSLDSPWLDLVGSFQRALGPHYVGKLLTSYRQVAPSVSESVFGSDLTVLANWRPAQPYVSAGSGIAPSGFLARSADGSVLAGSFVGSLGGAPLSPGTHYVLVERAGDSMTVRQPVGDDTDLALEWTGAGTARVQALAPDGTVLGDVAATLAGGRVRFHYAAALGGSPVGAYRVSADSAR